MEGAKESALCKYKPHFSDFSCILFFIDLEKHLCIVYVPVLQSLFKMCSIHNLNSLLEQKYSSSHNGKKQGDSKKANPLKETL